MFPYTLVGIDPGVITGMAWYDPDGFDGKLFGTFESREPEEIYQEVKVLALRPKPVFLVVEDFVGSGNLKAEGKATIKVLGMVQYGFCTTKNIRGVAVRNPQKRKAFVSMAERMFDGDRFTTIRKGNGYDAWQALAHCLSYYHDYTRKSASV